MPAKGAIHRKRCAVEGCPYPPHVFDDGRRAKVCREHLLIVKLNAKRKRIVIEVLTRLQTAKKQDAPFVDLSDVPMNTRQSLTENDWIFKSVGIDGTVKYAITGRGAQALAVLKQKLLRTDGMCPKCGEHPRHTTRSGRLYPYCRECLMEMHRKRNVQQRMVTPKSPCPNCGERPRHRYQTGKWAAYCAECLKEKRRYQRNRYADEWFARIEAGEPPPVCRLCKTKPAAIYNRSISLYCVDCKRKLDMKSSIKKAMKRLKRSAGE